MNDPEPQDAVVELTPIDAPVSVNDDDTEQED